MGGARVLSRVSVRFRVRVRVLNSRFITRLVLRSSHPRPSRREVTRTPTLINLIRVSFGAPVTEVSCVAMV